MCNRTLAKAFAYAAGYPVGPRCAKKKNIIPPKPVKSAAVRVDDRQRDLFEQK